MRRLPAFLRRGQPSEQPPSPQHVTPDPRSHNGPEFNGAYSYGLKRESLPCSDLSSTPSGSPHFQYTRVSFGNSPNHLASTLGYTFDCKIMSSTPQELRGLPSPHSLRVFSPLYSPHLWKSLLPFLFVCLRKPASPLIGTLLFSMTSCPTDI